MNPIIGITTSGKNDKWVESPYYDHYFILPDAYVDAIRGAGGIPVLLPPHEPHLEQLVQMVDGIIISGGGDICPDVYGGHADHPRVARVDEERDRFELSIIRQAMKAKDKPVLCICRGMQILNVARNGTMHEHIPDIREEDIHRNADGFWTVHDVKVKSGSKLADAMQATKVQTYSGHHQAVKRVGSGLEVVATAPDGIIEGLEAINHPYLVGVQWHPEKSAEEDETQQALFASLIAAARKVKMAGA